MKTQLLLLCLLATPLPTHSTHQITAAAKNVLIPLQTTVCSGLHDLYEHRHAVCIGLTGLVAYNAYVHHTPGQKKQTNTPPDKRLTELEKTVKQLTSPNHIKQALENMFNDNTLHDLSEQERTKLLFFHLNAQHRNTIALKEQIKTLQEKITHLQEHQSKKTCNDHFFPET